MSALRKSLGVAAVTMAGTAVTFEALSRRRLQRAREQAVLGGRAALVTGGSRGLGLLLARELLRLGATVTITARNSAELDRARVWLSSQVTSPSLAAPSAPPRGEVHAIPADLRRKGDVQRLIDEALARMGRLDLLINDAGIIQVGPADVMDEQDMTDAMDTNFWGTVHPTMLALGALRKTNGTIVNITSVGGVVPVPHLLPYTASKFATVGFSEGLATEVRNVGVHVVTVVPWLMRTGSFIQALFKGQRLREFQWFSLGAALPLISLDAERAARKIILATLAKRPVATIGVFSRLGLLAHGLAPNLLIGLNRLINRLLPASSAISEQSPLPERRHHQAAEPGIAYLRRPDAQPTDSLTTLGKRAARRFNETPDERPAHKR